jgi:DNA-directed RNA polymerase specialized sigma24 family protein
MHAIHTITAQAQRRELFTRLYQEAFPGVAVYIRSRGGGYEDAAELFQQALIVFYERRLLQPGLAEGKEAAYLGGIVRHLWLKEAEKQKKQRPLDDLAHGLAYPESETVSAGRIEKLLAGVGQRCMQLLRAFYFEQQKPAEIAGEFGFSGIRSATVQKYKCLEKVRETVQQKQLRYADFTE